jgi:membrane fusion protein (multidrug efflux system)
MADAALAHSNATETASSPGERRWVRLVPWIILALVIGAITLVSVRWNSFEADRVIQTTDNATIQADSAVIDAKVSGYVRSVNFVDFQTVRAGDLLVQLDDRDFRASVLHAEAALAKAQAILDNLDHEVAAQRATIAQAKASVDSSTSKLTLAIDDDRRFAALASSGAVTGQEADSARSNAAVVRASQAGNLAAVDLANRQRCPRRAACPARSRRASRPRHPGLGEDRAVLYPHRRPGGWHDRPARRPARKPVEPGRRGRDLRREDDALCRRQL